MKYPLLPIASFLLILSPLHSQQGWRRLTTDDGLNNNKVLTIYQAKKGDIWIGTEQGIHRYNGIFEESSLFGSVNGILESPLGQLIAREVVPGNNRSSVSINLFDGLEWDEPDFFADNDITVSDMPEYVVASGGKLWMSTRDGLVGFDGQEWQIYDPEQQYLDWLIKTPDHQLWSHIWRSDVMITFDGLKWTPAFDTRNSIFDKIGGIIQTAISTSTGEILLGTDKGLFQYDPVSKTITDLKLGPIEVSYIYEMIDQSLWVGTTKGLNQLAGTKWQQTLVGQSISFIQQTRNGELWVGTNQGLYRLKQGEWGQEMGTATNCLTELSDGTLLVGGNDGLRIKPPVEEILPVLTQLQGNLISKLFLASDGTMWCCSTAGIFSNDGITWTNHGLKSPDIRQWLWTANIFEDSKGRIWFALPSSVLMVFSDGKLEPSAIGGSNWRSEIIETSDGRMWAAGYAMPSVYDGNEKKEWAELSGYKDSKPSDVWSYAIHSDNDGSIWVGGAEGIWRFKNEQWKGYTDVESRIVPTVYDFIRGPDGTFWAGTSQGIYKLNADKWVRVITGSILQFHITNDGSIVAIDAGAGLLTNRGPRWVTHASYGSGRLYQDWYGHGFVEYPTGVFWLATNKGLRRIQGDFWYDLTMDEGLSSNDVHTVELDNAGNLWVGTGEGVTRFTPPKNPNPPAVQLVRIDGDDIPDDRVHTTGRAFVTVDWRGGDIETEPNRLQFQYNIDGQWSEPLKQKTATIGMQNGKHQFSIRAIDHHFNVSLVDSMTVIVKTELPIPKIVYPVDGDIVSEKFYIKGKIKDDDFAAFQVFLSDSELTEVPKAEDDVEANLQKTYRLIYQADGLPRTATLVQLNTKELDDGDYQIWLTAQDQFQHSSFDKIVFRVDNTAPKTKIISPQANERVLKNVDIFAVASDIHLQSYRMDYTGDLATSEWVQIYVKADQYKRNPEVLLPTPEMKTGEIQQEWEVPVKEGQVWIRLTATDIAGNTSSQTIQVEVPTAVVTRKGGTIFPEDQQAELYFPPNTLAQDEIVTVNAVPEVAVEPPVRRISQVYDFAPTKLRLNAIKPATLILSYDPSQLSAGKEPLIFHRTDGAWKAVGGTVNAQQQTISAAVLSLGQYTLGEMDQIQAQDSAKLKPDSLTCQPRVFSPKGNAFSAHTTISFTLDQPAQVTIKVYSVAGQLVEWIAQQRTFGSGKQAIRWAGRDSDGEIVASGLYIVTVTVGSQTQDRVVNVWNH